MAQMISLIYMCVKCIHYYCYYCILFIYFFCCIVSIFAALFISCYSFKATFFLLLCSYLTYTDTGVFYSTQKFSY